MTQATTTNTTTKTTTKRQNGFYWIELRSGIWEPAEWDNELNEWWIVGSECSFTDSWLRTIGPKIEPQCKQCGLELKQYCPKCSHIKIKPISIEPPKEESK